MTIYFNNNLKINKWTEFKYRETNLFSNKEVNNNINIKILITILTDSK